MDMLFKHLPLASLVLMLSASSIEAQAKVDSGLRSQSVTVVLKDGFTRTSLAAVVRRTIGPDGVDIIALNRADLTPELFAATLWALSNSRSVHGNAPTTEITLLFPRGAPNRPVESAEKGRLVGAIAQLRAAPPQWVERVGKVPSIRVPLAH